MENMINFRKGLNLKLISLTVAILFLFTNQVYSYPLSNQKLRVPSSMNDEELQGRIQKALASNQAGRRNFLKAFGGGTGAMLALSIAFPSIPNAVSAAALEPPAAVPLVTAAQLEIDNEITGWFNDLGYNNIPEDIKKELLKLFERIKKHSKDKNQAKAAYRENGSLEIYADNLKKIIEKIWMELIEAKYFVDDKKGMPNALMRFLVAGMRPDSDIFQDIEDSEAPIDKEALRKRLILSAIPQLDYIIFKYLRLDPIPAFGNGNSFNLVPLGGNAYLFIHIPFGRVFKIDMDVHYSQPGEQGRKEDRYRSLRQNYRINPETAGRAFYNAMAGMRRLYSSRDVTLHVGRDDMENTWIRQGVNAIAPFLLVCDSMISIGNNSRNMKEYGLSFAVRLFRASAYIELGEFPKALNEVEHAGELNPFCDEVWLQLGEIYGSQGNFNDAKKAYQWAMEINPGNPWSHVLLGRLYVDTKLGYQREISELENRKRKGMPVEAYRTRLIELNRKAKYNYEEAVRELEIGLTLGGISPETYSGLGEAYYYLADIYTDRIQEVRTYSSAIDALDKAIRLSTKDAGLYLLRGMSYFRLMEREDDETKKLGDRKKAVMDLARAVEIDRKYQPIIPEELQKEVDEQRRRLSPISDESGLLLGGLRNRSAL